MKKINNSTRTTELLGRVIYRESTDCGRYQLMRETDSGYKAINLETGEEIPLTYNDLIGDYLEDVPGYKTSGSFDLHRIEYGDAFKLIQSAKNYEYSRKDLQRFIDEVGYEEWMDDFMEGFEPTEREREDIDQILTAAFEEAHFGEEEV